MTTRRRSRENPAVRDFILRNVDENPAGIAALAANEFGLSRAAINNYLKRLIEEGLVQAEGKTNRRRYELRDISATAAMVNVVPGMAEHEVWRDHVARFLKDVAPNVADICHYGFTEMFNNVIDHSNTKSALVTYAQNYDQIALVVTDFGVGIFNKIQQDFKLEDPRTALLELSKGKLTSDRTKHSGEGIFFTSRMFNSFMIFSGYLGYSRKKEGSDWAWLIETEELFDATQGTIVSMKISTAADWTMQEVFQRYEGEGLSFAKTHVPIKLGKYGNEQLVSRSQAKRILARFDRFEEVFLDFQGVPTIGQPFADELFRVFTAAHPDTKITVINTSSEIDRMIAHVQAAERQGLLGPSS